MKWTIFNQKEYLKYIYANYFDAELHKINIKTPCLKSKFKFTWEAKRPVTGELLLQRPHLAGFRFARKEEVFAAAELNFPLPGVAALGLVEQVVGVAIVPKTGLAPTVELL